MANFNAFTDCTGANLTIRPQLDIAVTQVGQDIINKRAGARFALELNWDALFNDPSVATNEVHEVWADVMSLLEPGDTLTVDLQKIIAYRRKSSGAITVGGAGGKINDNTLTISGATPNRGEIFSTPANELNWVKSVSGSTINLGLNLRRPLAVNSSLTFNNPTGVFPNDWQRNSQPQMAFTGLNYDRTSSITAAQISLLERL